MWLCVNFNCSKLRHHKYNLWWLQLGSKKYFCKEDLKYEIGNPNKYVQENKIGINVIVFLLILSNITYLDVSFRVIFRNLNHLFTMHLFSIPWEHQKNLRFGIILNYWKLGLKNVGFGCLRLFMKTITTWQCKSFEILAKNVCKVSANTTRKNVVFH